MKYILGVDTSCYTTSLALVNLQGDIVFNHQELLQVKKGERGLQQSNALFQHVKNIPMITSLIKKHFHTASIAAVCASTKPRPYEDSYMPVFMASLSFGQAFSDLLNVPYFEVSHQENHIMSGHHTVKELISPHFLAVHLSGGTTELLDVHSSDTGYEISLVGASQDLHAGQFVDRIGVAMQLPFPAGSALEALADESHSAAPISFYVKGLTVGFSGAESQGQRLIQNGACREDVALGVYQCLIKTLEQWLFNAVQSGYPKNILLVGGVCASRRIKDGIIKALQERDDDIRLYFADPKLSKDNAVGTALLGLKAYIRMI